MFRNYDFQATKIINFRKPKDVRWYFDRKDPLKNIPFDFGSIPLVIGKEGAFLPPLPLGGGEKSDYGLSNYFISLILIFRSAPGHVES